MELKAPHFAWLSIAASLATIVLKTLAWWLTGSVGLLSDALESLVNLAGSSFALWMILITRDPPDGRHPFGHGKAEYFSSGFEGLLILGAALAIIVTAMQRFISPQPLESPGWGLVWSAAATLINLAVALILARAGRRLNSIALSADSRHLMTDVWTSVGVILAVALVAWSGWLILDPLVAVCVGVQIMVEAWRLLHEAVDGLMDRSLAPEAITRIDDVLDGFRRQGIVFTELRTRRAGASSFLQLKVRVPGEWTVSVAHARVDEIESALSAAEPGLEVTTHLEPFVTMGDSHVSGTP